MPIGKKQKARIEKKPVNIAIYLDENLSSAIGLIIKDIFKRANKLMLEELFAVNFINIKTKKMNFDGVEIHLKKWTNDHQMLIIPPFNSDFNYDLSKYADEIKFIKSLAKKGTNIVSICHGAFLFAESGILNGREATTHWRAISIVKNRYPDVRWTLNKMICDNGNIITSGGYLGAVDLCLYLVEKYHSKKLAQDLGEYLLAGSVRQKQSLYARNLVVSPKDNDTFFKFEKWIEKNINSSISVQEMAEQVNMSLRSFHRHFTADLGISPNKYLQLKRIEKAKLLLSNSKLSLEEIIEKIGLADLSAFRKIFYREIGVSPSEFRRRGRVL